MLKILKSTPFYVWMVLAYLLFVGIKSLKTRLVYFPQLFVLPLTLLGIKYKTFLSQGAIPFIVVILLTTLVSFFVHAGAKIKVIKNLKSVELPGSYLTLVILIAFFAVKYYFGYLNFTEPSLGLKYALVENILSGIFSGYPLGKAIRYIYKYFTN